MDGLFEYDGKILTSELADIFQSTSNLYSLCKMNKVVLILMKKSKNLLLRFFNQNKMPSIKKKFL